MNTSLTIYAKIEALPPSLKEQALNYVEFLSQKVKKNKKQIIVPEFGCMKGKITMSDDFDAPLDEYAA